MTASTIVAGVKTWTPNAAGASLGTDDILADLANTNLTEVRIEANNALGMEFGDIVLSAGLVDNTMRATKTLTLTARNRIILTNSNGIFSLSPLNVNLTANGSQGENQFSVSMETNANISTQGGDVTIVSTSTNTGANATAVNAQLISTLSTAAFTNIGKISITANSAGTSAAIKANEDILTAGGDITIEGTNTNTGAGALGVWITQNVKTNASTLIGVPPTTGKISITGTTAGNALAVRSDAVSTLTAINSDVTIW